MTSQSPTRQTHKAMPLATACPDGRPTSRLPTCPTSRSFIKAPVVRLPRNLCRLPDYNAYAGKSGPATGTASTTQRAHPEQDMPKEMRVTTSER